MKTFTRCLTFLMLAALCVAAVAPGFKVTKKYPLPGDGGFDYLFFDTSSNRVYVSHENVVDVLDADSGKVVGKVEGTPGVHGIAIVPALKRGFTTNEGDSTVSVFDTTTFKTIKKISVEKDPDFILYDPGTRRVLVCHSDGAAITAIDPEKQVILGKMALDGPAEAAVVNGKGTAFVNLEDQSEVVSFDPQALTVKQKYPITGCKGPTGMAIDAPNSRLFIGCRGAAGGVGKVLAVMDALTGKVITTLPIGTRVDAVSFDADNKLVFASNYDGTVSVIRQKNANEYESVGDIQTQVGAKTMTFDPKTKRLFLSTAEMQAPAVGGRATPKPGTFSVLVVERQ